MLRSLDATPLSHLYDIRNNQGVGHAGGDVDPNFADATAVSSAASWLMAEPLRIFQDITINEAWQIVDALIKRTQSAYLGD
jgi:hypothetical protein